MDTNQEMIDQALPGIFFDIGASVGAYTVPMSVKATTIYAFEPTSLNYGTLVKNTTTCTNVVAEKIAVSNSVGTAKIYGASRKDIEVGWGGSTINPAMRAELPYELSGLDNFEEVPTTTVDQYCSINGITGITAMKIDVEGAEEYVLEGAQETLKANNPVISLETHWGIDTQKIYDLLSNAGYSVYLNGETLVNSIVCSSQYLCRK